MAARRAKAGGGSSAGREKGRRREDVVGGWLLDSRYIAYITQRILFRRRHGSTDIETDRKPAAAAVAAAGEARRG